MARRRGFFAELQYQAQQAEKRKRQQHAVAYGAQFAAQLEAERARREAEYAAAAAARASEADRYRLQVEAAQRHVEARLAEVDSLNADLASSLDEIDGMLAATLEVDDFVDLEALRVAAVEHPPFEPGELGVPTAALPALVYPPQPVYQEPPAPRGLIGAKKKQQEAMDRARAEYEAASRQWHEHATRMHAEFTAALERREQAEAARVAKLAAARAAYEQDCRQREVDAEARNQELAKLINELAFDVESAIQQYVDIVLSNSVYPDAFPVSYEHEFSLASRELTLTVTVPPPSAVPSVKEYRYIKAKDEIASTMLPVKAQKDRYANAIWQAAVRSLHEVFEADRDAKIHSIALTVGVDRISPATGHPETVPLVIVAADREAFTAFDLAKIVPRATLEHLGAALSKSPNDLTPADTSRGVRVRGQ